MRRMTSAVLVFAAALCAFLFTASVAAAQAPTVIDAVDTPTQGWQPPNVTVSVGDTVRWEFDQAVASHNVASSSDNWELTSTPGVNRPPVEHTFDAPGLYTFLCEVHPGMTGSVTVEGDEPADPLENILVFSKTAGFRHPSIPQGIAALEALGSANDFNVDTTEDASRFTDANLAQYDAVVFLSTTGNILNDRQQEAFERYIQAGNGYVGIHAASDTEYDWTWYGEMLGGYFKSHPPGTPEADVHIEDGDEPSTTGLPATWHRTDEWYNFQSPVRPVPNGGGEDYSPRNSGVKVLATVDENTYDEQDDSPAADDHPIAWCSIFDGGRVWYTAGGHTPESFSEPQFRQHILGGIKTATGAEPADCGAPRESSPSGSDFEIVTLDDDTQSPMELAVADDGRVFYVERITGEINVWNPTTGAVTTALDLDVSSVQENGMIGLALSPDFNTTGHIYVTYTPLPNENSQTRVSRFTVGPNNTIAASSEQVIFTWEAQRELCCHSSGSLAFNEAGMLYIATGDNTNPFESDNYTPIDERPGRQFYDAQRTSANTNNLNGKILRIQPIPNATGVPGEGTTYTIPDGNMFEPGTPLTRPEIYAMGFRNPFRITIDPKTGHVLLGDYGPDAGAGNPNRGPQASVEFNIVDEPGFYGWPYCVRDNVPFNDYDFEEQESGPKFDCANPVNESPNNTGMTQLPPAQPAAAWLGYTETDPRHVGLGDGGGPTGGPRYDFDAGNPSTTKFPEFFDGRWFIGEWTRGWIKAATIDGDEITHVFPSPWMDTFFRPHELEFGPDGALYVIDWGDGFNGNNANSGLYRIDYVQGARRPVVRATATPDNGPAPLDVQLSSAGTVDPEGTALTYLWDFGDGTTSTDPNPQHRFSNPGTYNVVLRATDQSGKTGTDTVQVTAGNTRPTVELTIPENGQFADFGERIPFEVTVTDAEDGTIDCSQVVLNIQMGHDDHAHGLGQQTGCSGVFTAGSLAGHGADANTFISVVATYTDKAQGAAGRLSASDDAVLQPKTKQAEFYESTGRLQGVTNTGGDPGVQREASTDTGGGQNIGFIENGDFVSYTPTNLKNIRQLRFRVASGGDGGTLEVRLDSPTGDLVGSVPVANTGGWQNWVTATLALEDPPEGTHELFFVFRHPTSTGGLFNLNWFRAVGKGAAISEAPEVSATATPNTGTAPLTVQFDGTATDADSTNLTYRWDFGVAGTTADTSTEQDPSWTYERPGTYTARFTATDDQGATATTSVQVTVSSANQCPQNNVRSDEFEGDSLDTNRWQVIRPDNTRPPTVQGGSLRFPIDNGSIYLTGTSARNIIVQPLPDGDVEVTAKITTEPLTQDYQQAGLRVYAGDEDWASVHMISAGGQRDIEFIYENNNQPRNGPQDKLGGIPPTVPAEPTYWVKLISDGDTLRAQYSFDGTTFQNVGQPADISTWVDPKVGPVALSDQAPAHPVASFDWIRFEPDAPAGGGGGTSVVDDFAGTALGSAWEVVRQDQQLTVSGGALRIPAQPGDVYQGRNDAKNLVLRPIPTGAWTATAKLNFEALTNYQQAGIMLRGTDDELIKLGRIAHNAQGAEKFEYIWERLVNNAPTARNESQDSTTDLPDTFPDDFWVRMVSDGTNVTGSYSIDGSQWTPVGRPAPQPANAKVGMFAFGADATGDPVAAFDSFTLTTGSGGPAGPSRDDDFEGSTLDKTRWDAMVNENAQAYSVAGGELTITTEAGDIYSTPNGNPKNFILQDASHAGADWTIETKLSGTINGGWGQGGLIAYGDAGNYVKLNAIADNGDPRNRINRLELRTEVNDSPSGPQGVPDPEVPDNTPDIWLRLKKTGTTYAGEYSFNGTTWTSMGSVTNAVANPDFGLYAFGPVAAGQGDAVSFDYFLLDGRDAGGCACTGAGDEFDGASLDKNRWNAIVREDESLYELDNGWLEITTVNGDIYTNGNPAPTKNFILQEPTEANQDWVIETHIDAASLSQGYEQAGLMVRQDDDNYIKFDILSDEPGSVRNRLELRSEINGAIQSPTPADPAANNAEEVWLRLTKAGTTYTGEYSFDGENWSAIASPVTNPMVDPAFGIFTLGVNSGGGTARFEYFEVDGSRGCEVPNRAPVIDEIAAAPSSGFAPLEVDFTSDASDPEGDDLTYSWDFDGDGEGDADTANASYTYDEPGDYEAELTVSDGERATSRTVAVSVLEEPDDEARFSLLVFSKTAGFRHDSIDEGHAAIEALGAENDFHVDHTEDATAFRDAILNRYDAVVFLSTTGDVLNATQQRAFERFIQKGGGFAGIHAAADTEYDWNWYGHLVGGYFLSHPPGTPDATVHVEDGEHHSTQGLPTPWPRTDEWYNYRSPDYQDPDVPDGDYSPRDGGVHVLLTVDEATYAEGDGSEGVDDDHPISWCQAYDGGRSWYTGMGHTAATFSEPEFLLHLLGGIETAAGMPGTEGCDPPNEVPTVLAAADPDTGRAPLTVRFSAAGSDADGDQLTYAWEFGDGQRSFRQNPTHVYQAPGRYAAKVTVTDGNGGSASATVAVNVTNPPGNVAPTVLAAADPASGRPPLRVRFSAAGSDADGDALTYAWDFGDGGAAYGAQATHTYQERGTYTARVTVTDSKGATGTATVQVRVTRSGGVAGESDSRPGVQIARSQDAERVVDKGLRFRVSCEVFCRVTSTLRMRGGDDERLGASSARRIGAGKSRQVVVKLDRRVRRNLLDAMDAAGLSRVRATLVIRVTTADGATTLRRNVTLTR